MPSQAEIDQLYESIGDLGEGGFGVVELVRHRETGCLFARKKNRQLSDYVQWPEFRNLYPDVFGRELRRVVREGSLLQTVRGHRAILQVVHTYLVDETSEGVIVTELCCGGSLRRLIRTSAGGSDARYARFRDTLAPLFEGIEFLHHRGIVHRDLKPENVLLRSHDDHRDVAISDFGLAKLVDQVTWSKQAGTSFTLVYGSSEQMADVKAAGLPTDIFALAVVAAELISGKRAFDAVDERMPFRRIAGRPDVNSVLEVLRVIDMREVLEAMLADFTASPRLRNALIRSVHRDQTIRPLIGELVAANAGASK